MAITSRETIATILRPSFASIVPSRVYPDDNAPVNSGFMADACLKFETRME